MRLVGWTSPGNSGPDGLAIGPDGNVWFMDESGGGPPATMERMTPVGDVTGYPLPDAPGGIEATDRLDLIDAGITTSPTWTLTSSGTSRSAGRPSRRASC